MAAFMDEAQVEVTRQALFPQNGWLASMMHPYRTVYIRFRSSRHPRLQQLAGSHIGKLLPSFGGGGGC